MAVFNDYVDSNIRAKRITTPLAGGVILKDFLIPFDTVAADDAGSIYRVIRGIPATAVPFYLWIYTDGVTSMNDVDVCLYKPLEHGGAEVGTEVLASTIDLSSAVARTAPKDGLGNVTMANWGKMLYELAGETVSSHQPSYDIGLKSVADLAEADQIVVVARFAL